MAQGHYDLLEEGAHPGFYQLSVEGGVRYNWEHKIFSLDTFVIASWLGSVGPRISTLPPQTEREDLDGRRRATSRCPTSRSKSCDDLRQVHPRV